MCHTTWWCRCADSGVVCCGFGVVIFIIIFSRPVKCITVWVKNALKLMLMSLRIFDTIKANHLQQRITPKKLLANVCHHHSANVIIAFHDDDRAVWRIAHCLKHLRRQTVSSTNKKAN